MSDIVAARSKPFTPAPPAAQAVSDMPLPVVRLPMLDAKRQLFAYEILFHREGIDEATLMQRVLSTLLDGALTRLVRGNRTFLELSREVLLEQTDVLLHQPRFGALLRPDAAADVQLMERLQHMAQRGCLLMLDLGDTDPDASPPLEALLQITQFVRLNASTLSPETLAKRSQQLHQRGLWVVAGHVDDHATYHRCLELPLQAIQGRYLLVPETVEVPVLAANRLSMLRLMREMQESKPGPIELGNLIRNDAVLSFKLLGCVNSAYFALPRQLKSVQQAAIFFGVTRMRNWIYTMSLSGMDDRPPELLRAALIRAQMCQTMASGMSLEQQEMAFTTGLFSLLDVLMSAPMAFLLSHLPLVPEISAALLRHEGAFGALLDQVCAWEAGDMSSLQTQPQRVQRMATIYLEATQWADQVFAASAGQAA